MTDEYFKQISNRANLMRNTPEMKVLIEDVVLKTIQQ
jgi:hypothetical protein